MLEFIYCIVNIFSVRGNVRAPDCVGENTHAAVNRKCRLRWLDVRPLRWLVKLNKESRFWFGSKSLR